jgi:hypothetical protein
MKTFYNILSISLLIGSSAFLTLVVTGKLDVVINRFRNPVLMSFEVVAPSTESPVPVTIIVQMHQNGDLTWKRPAK